MYSYDRRNKVASFQDRVKGSFEGVVWINDFVLEKNKTVTIKGTISLILDGESADLKFTDVSLKKKGKAWAVDSTGAEPVAEVVIAKLVAQNGKTAQELDRLSKMK